MVEPSASWTEAEAAAIQEQLDRMLKCDLFTQASRQSRFFGYIVDATLSGNSGRLNQFVVGVDVFDRDESFDPVVDSIVRVEAGRLRSKLFEYYAGPGNNDPIVISLPKGGYGVHIELTPQSNTVSESFPKEPSKWPNMKIIGLVAGLLIGGIYLVFFLPAKTETGAGVLGSAIQNVERQSGKPAIAVLPFDNMSPDPSHEYFSDGITEDIITDLSIVSGLTVIARHSTFVYKGQSISIREIGEDLGARYVLEGSVRRDGSRLRITAQLIDALTDTHLWAERYDRNLDDIFAIQSEVSQMIVSELEVTLTDLESQRLGHRGTDSTTAHDLFLRGREQFYLFTPEDIDNSLNLLSSAIEIDPRYAEAYAWKSRVLVFTFISGINNSSEETVEPAIALAKKAVELDEFLPIAHANLGWALRWNQHYDEALSAVETAINLDTNFADAYLWRSLILSTVGRGPESIVSAEQGILVDPSYGVTFIFALGRGYYALGEYEKALEHFDRGINHTPNFILNHVYKFSTLANLGRNEEAELAESELVQIYPDYKFSAAYLFYLDELVAE